MPTHASISEQHTRRTHDPGGTDSPFGTLLRPLVSPTSIGTRAVRPEHTDDTIARREFISRSAVRCEVTCDRSVRSVLIFLAYACLAACIRKQEIIWRLRMLHRCHLMHAIAIRAPAAFRFAFITQRRQRNSRATDWIALAEAWSSRDGNIGAAYCHHGPIGGKKNFAMVVEQRVDWITWITKLYFRNNLVDRRCRHERKCSKCR